MQAQQDEGLEMIVAGVRTNPGFMSGYWSRGVDDPTASTTFIVFDELEHARSFAASVRANTDAQTGAGINLVELLVVSVTASAEGAEVH